MPRRFSILIRFVLPLALACGAISSVSAQDGPFTRSEATSALAEIRRIVADNGVERLETVELGGVKQWISIRGQDRDNPVLLFLHGGPGFPMMPTAWSYQRGWEDYFTVVQWDQRGAGKTYAAHDPDEIAPTMTKAQIVADAEELIQWLLAEFGKDKIVLAGLSWGSVVGVEVARRRPEWLHAYVGFGQVVDFAENERRGWAFAMAQATADGNDEAVAALNGIAPYPSASVTPDDLYTQRRWLSFYGGAMHNRDGYGAPAGGFVLAPEYTDADLAVWSEGTVFSFEPIFPDLMAFSVMDVRRLDCPVILFSGRHDHNVSSTLGEEWFARLKAPAKEFVWFEQSAHLTMIEEPGKTLVALVGKVRPFAEAAGDAPAGEKKKPRR